MGDEKVTLWQEIQQGALKALIWGGYISIGVFAKLAFDSRNNVLSRRQVIVKTILSIFIGYLSAYICEKTGQLKWIGVIVPVCTLLGEGIVLHIMNNYKQWFAKWLPTWINQLKKDK